MGKIIVATLLFLGAARASGDIPANWKIVKDSKGACQISVPENWTVGEDNTGSAYWQAPSVAIVVVTSQPNQQFKPVADFMLTRTMNVPKENVFENSAKRVFFQDRLSPTGPDTRSLSVMVPGRTGTCSAHLVLSSTVTDETGKKIAFSLAPAPEGQGAAQ